MSISPSAIRQRPGERENARLPLQSGDRLPRAEFEKRYQNHPEIKKAELVEGVVYVASPTHQEHATFHFDIILWLGNYRAATPGVRGSDNATLRLDFENELQPDALLRLDHQLGGQSTVSEDDYLEGTPELVVEVAASSASYDMHDKLRAYARNGVPEYIVLLAHERRLVWFILREGVYEPQEADEGGILRSEVFPGLWLQAEALLAGEMDKVLAALQEGLASDAHSEFVRRLQAE